MVFRLVSYCLPKWISPSHPNLRNLQVLTLRRLKNQGVAPITPARQRASASTRLLTQTRNVSSNMNVPGVKKSSSRAGDIRNGTVRRKTDS